jgi:hypothetical protein
MNTIDNLHDLIKKRLCKYKLTDLWDDELNDAMNFANGCAAIKSPISVANIIFTPYMYDIVDNRYWEIKFCKIYGDKKLEDVLIKVDFTKYNFEEEFNKIKEKKMNWDDLICNVKSLFRADDKSYKDVTFLKEHLWNSTVEMIMNRFKMNKVEALQFLYYARTKSTGDDISFLTKEYIPLMKYIRDKYNKKEITNMQIYKYEGPDFIIKIDKKVIPVEIFDFRNEKIYKIDTKLRRENLKSLLFRNVYHENRSRSYTGKYNGETINSHFKKNNQYKQKAAELFDGDIQGTFYIINSYDRSVDWDGEISGHLKENGINANNIFLIKL